MLNSKIASTCRYTLKMWVYISLTNDENPNQSMITQSPNGFVKGYDMILKLKDCEVDFFDK